MTIVGFPPVSEADEDGLLAVGGDLEVDSLLLAYRSGIFPWPIGRILCWFAPPERAVFELDSFHVSASLRKRRRREPFRYAMNTNFAGVISACAHTHRRGSSKGTWIKPSIIAAYVELHQRGFAHSIEVYREEDLVGGVYGVSIGRMFAAESMFFRETDASKLALWLLVEHLRNEGAGWLDCQVLNPHLERLGATTIGRDTYMRRLAVALRQPQMKFPRGDVSWPSK